MLCYEWRKLLCYRKGLWLIAVLLTAKLLDLFLLSAPYDGVLEANRDIYDSYLGHVEGPLTPQKQTYIENEMLRLNAIHLQLEQLKNNYYTGTLTELQYRQAYNALAVEDQKFQGFSKLYSQYIYVREAPCRYLLYTGGWEALLGSRQPDYLYLLILVFLLAPVLCQEYGAQMDQIAIAQKKSAHGQWGVKVLAALLLTAGLTAVLQLLELGYCAVRFGLPHWDYTLQSLVSFGTAHKSLRLWQALTLLFLSKQLGYLYCALLILFVSTLVKKYALCLMAGIILLPLPFLAAADPAVFVRIPGPWAFTVGSYCLYGSGTLLGNKTVFLFQEVRWAELLLYMLWSIIMMFLMVFWIRRSYTNNHFKGKKRRISLLTIVTTLLLSGCAGQTEPVIYNSRESGWAEGDRFLVFSTGMEKALMIDKRHNTAYPFPPDAFSGETTFPGQTFFLQGQRLYYLQSTRQVTSAGLEAYQQQTAFMALELPTMQSNIVYHWKNDPHWFFGLLPKSSWEPQPNGVSSFFLHQGYAYAQCNASLLRMNLSTGTYAEFLTLSSASNLAYDGKHLYYLDAYSRLVVRDLDTDSSYAVEEVTAKDFLLTPMGIYYLNMRSNGALYHWDEERNISTKLDSSEAYGLHWDSHYCWIETLDGLFRMDHDGTDKVRIDHPGVLLCIPRSDCFYTVDYASGVIYRINKETLECAPVSQNSSSLLSIY